jgi:hypothetical protein
MDDQSEIAPEAIEADSTSAVEEQQTERDYEAEARQMGWRPPEDFPGDKSKFVDAETFVKRADEVMPFLKKQNTALKRELDDVKRQMRKSAEFISKAEERAYQRALIDLERRHDEAVETGDVAGSKALRREMAELADSLPEAPKVDEVDPAEAQKKLAQWVEDHDWYVTDDKKRAYADIQAGAMGPATEWDGGPDAWLDELAKRVERKFTNPKPSPVATTPSRGTAAKTGKGYADLPPEAKRIADKWDAMGIMTKADYAKNYEWN